MEERERVFVTSPFSPRSIHPFSSIQVQQTFFIHLHEKGRKKINGGKILMKFEFLATHVRSFSANELKQKLERKTFHFLVSQVQQSVRHQWHESFVKDDVLADDAFYFCQRAGRPSHGGP